MTTEESIESVRAPIAYVMTHYPRVALTYISGEIDALEARGLTILPFAMNAPAAEDLGSDDLRRRSARTVYLKSQWVPAIAALAAQWFRHPVGMTRLCATAVKSARLDLGLLVRRMAHLVEAALLARDCRRRGVRHLHAHFGQAPATLAWFASEMLRQDRDAAVGWSFTIHGFQDFVDDAVARLDLKAASASFVVCVSDFTRSQLCRITSPDLWDRFAVVRCGIDLANFPRRDQILHNEPAEIISVGRLSPEKGFSILLRALAILRDRGIAARLTLIGEGPERPALMRDIRDSDLQERVTLLGELPSDAVADRLRTADIFCLPSFSEGLPISIMEAMAIGVPVVATNIAGIPELAMNGCTALTVPASNVPKLAEALARLLTDGALGERLAGAARLEVERRHDRDTNADEMLALYQSKALLS
jgi:glycosyltransferase involved in cell wall biosynthesis